MLGVDNIKLLAITDKKIVISMLWMILKYYFD